MLNVDWTSLFKTVGLNKASYSRSLKSERLVPADPSEDPMPSGSVMNYPSAEEYLEAVHGSYLNCGNANLHVVSSNVIDTEGFVRSMNPETASAGTGPFEVPSHEASHQLNL